MNTLCRCDRDPGSRATRLGSLAALLALLSLPLFAQSQSNQSQSNQTQSNQATPGLADRTQAYDVDIGRVSRVQALHELSTQTGLLLGYLSSDGAEEQAVVGPVKGRYSIEDVLRELLRDSVLTFRWVEPHIISVEPIRLAGTSGKGDIVELPETSARSRDAIAALGPPEEITVISSALREFSYAAAPARIIDRERIDAIGAPTLAEALKYISQSAYTRPEGYRTSGAQYAEMRGLGPDTALILINGRRALPSANSVTSSAFDLNTVPITAVERIELLLDSAAAIYGTDAIGGVINIVLRERVPEPTVEMRYGAADGGAEQMRATLSGESHLGLDRLRVAAVVDYFELDGLRGEERDRWRDLDFRRFGGADRRSLISNPGNISAALPGNLPGLSSPFAAVPLTDSTPGISRDDFAATAGQRNFGSLLEYTSVVPEATRFSVATMASFDLSERLTASAEVLYVDRDATYYFAPPVIPGLPVAPGNAFNPFGVPVIANRLIAELGSQSQYVESKLLRAVGAVQGEWGAWDWEVSLLHSEEEATTWLNNSLDMQRVLAALSSADPRLALNPFQSGAVGSPELLTSLLATRDVDELASAGSQVTGYVQGPLWQLPAGALAMVVGGEWRNETAQFDAALGEFDRDVTAGFAQLRLPIVSQRMRLPALHELSLTAGARWDSYSDLERVFRSQYGAIWKPHPYFTVRASTGKSYRPPSLYELHLPETATVARLSDPARNNEQATIAVSVGGNSELDAATAESVTAGIAFATGGPRHWKISADYWRVEMDHRVAAIPLALLLANEDQFAERIVRATPTPADVQAGLPGTLRSIDTSRINAGRVEASGVDFSISADFKVGDSVLSPELLTTWFDEFLAIDVPGMPALDRVNLASEQGTIAEWRAIGTLGWQRGPYGATAIARYTPSYDDAVAGVRIGRSVESQTLFDLQASIDMGLLMRSSPSWRGFKLTAGAVNVFDEEPRFAAVGDVVGFDMSQADLKQRSFYLRLDKKF